jgi:outer membrane protein TolC
MRPGRSLRFILAGIIFLMMPAIDGAAEPTLHLQDLIAEALSQNPEILMFDSGAMAAKHRIPQAKSLADPMIMFGYQNEGFDALTYPEMADSQFMFSVSQMFPYPGKRALKGKMAAEEAGSLHAATDIISLRTIERVRGLFYDLFFSYKNLDIIQDKAALFSQFEAAATARYSSGSGMLQEVVMAQSEKYMLVEKEAMLRQKIASIEAMLCSAIGREACDDSLGVPAEPPAGELAFSLEEAVARANEKSPVITAKQKMIAAVEAKVEMAEKEYYPDFTITGIVMEKGSEFEDMWSLTAAINVPIFFRTKQRQGVFEAKAQLAEARHDLAATKIMLTATIKDNYAMMQSAAQLMDLYKDGLIPKTHQDFDLAMNGYVNGKTEALTVINRLNSLIDFQLLYWERFTERERAIARIETAVGSSLD